VKLQQMAQKTSEFLSKPCGLSRVGQYHCCRHVTTRDIYFPTSNEETMKKVLLASAALLAVVALSAPAKADPLKVTVGGSVKFEAGFVDEKYDSNYRPYDFTNSPELSIGAEGKADNGLVYGGKIEVVNELNFDRTLAFVDENGSIVALNPEFGSRSQEIKFDKAAVYFGGKWGKVELGDEASAGNRLGVTAPTGFGTGGFAGDYQNFLLINNVASIADGTKGFSLPTEGFYFRSLANSYKASLSESGLEDYENSTKISYFTPKFSGVQLGVSLTPKVGDTLNTVNRDKKVGYAVDNAPADVTQYDNLIESAINYSYKMDNGLGLAASLGYNHANATDGLGTDKDREDLNSFNAGLSGTYAGFTLGGGYTFNGDSGLAKQSSAASRYDDNGQTFNVGLQYATGPFAVGVNYLNAETEGDVALSDNVKLQTVGLGATYELAPGLSTFAEVDFVNYEAEGQFLVLGTETSKKYDSTVFILGTKLDF
jgi:predicted porin